MIQTNSSISHGYQFNTSLYDPENNNYVLMKQNLGIASAIL